MLGRAVTADVVEASVVAGALRRGDAVMTGDPGDLDRLARSVGRRINVIAI
jgi:hypothetical protein